MLVILNEVKNLMISTESTIKILRLSPQNDITTESLEGGGDYWGDLKYSLLIFNVHTIMD